MEELQQLLFELAGPDRLSILFELQKKPQKLSHLSKNLNFTVQETSRNVARLNQTKLVTKAAEGNLGLTSYGEEILGLLLGFDFLSRHSGYFTKHSLAGLPKEFRYNLAALNGCQLVEDVMVAFAKVEHMIQLAQDYVWILTNQILVSSLPYLQDALRRGVKFRLIMPSSVTPPKDALERMYDPVFLEAMQKRQFENRFLPRVDVLICMSEKGLAALGFSDTEGKIDYHGFQGTDDLAFKWAKGLFLNYWNSAATQPTQV